MEKFSFFFFKQKTAYEIKECDWSSDVCSSDLGRVFPRRVPWRVRNIDIAPTIMELAGISKKIPMQGESLVKMMEGEGSDRPAYLESLYPKLHYGWSAIRGLAADGYTVIHAPIPELYKWEDDPRQTHNLADKKTDLTNSWIKRLNVILNRIHNPVLAGLSQENMTDEERRKLDALGYFSIADPIEGTFTGIIEIGGINPASMKFFQMRFTRALTAMADEDYEEAVLLFDGLLKTDPENKWLMLYKGTTYELNSDMENARAAFLHILEKDPEYIYALSNMSWLELKEENLDKAESYALKVIEINKNDAEMYTLLAKVEAKRKNIEKTKQLLEMALLIAPSEIDPLKMLGTMLMNEGKMLEAKKLFENAFLHAPDDIAVLHSLGEIRLLTGDRAGALEVFTHAAELDTQSAYEIGRASCRERV